MKTSFIGFILAIVIMVAGVMFTTKNYFIYLNYMSIIIVLGGTVAASIITFGIKDLFKIINVVARTFYKSFYTPEHAIKDLIEVSVKVQKNPSSINSIISEGKVHPFFIDGLKLIQNDFERSQIKQIMESSLKERRNHHLHHVEIMKALAKYPPAFGMIGTVLGLVAILQELGAKAGVDTIGPNMAVALITTLYGLFFANYFFIPISDNLLHRLDAMMTVRKLIIKGLLLINDKEDPVFMQEMLNAHLLPADREDFLASAGA